LRMVLEYAFGEGVIRGGRPWRRTGKELGFP
jgi:hypothetical protein